MGREIKRVPLDFDWPRDQVWSGFLMPNELDGSPCTDCKGGQTHAGWWLQHLIQRLHMLGSDVLDQEQGKLMHPWLANDPYPPTDSTHLFMAATKVLRPGPDIITLLAGLRGESVEDTRRHLAFGGFDYKPWKAIVKAAGLESWGSCETCGGHGSLERYPGQRAEAEAWTPTEPPTGEGWQLWETVSEGSPISPVFADAEGLAQWLTTPASCWGATTRPMTIEQARSFVDAGWAPTGFINAGGVHDGAEYIGTERALNGGSDGPA